MIAFVLKYTENDIKDRYVYSLHNKNSRNALHFSFIQGIQKPSMYISISFPIVPKSME